MPEAGCYVLYLYCDCPNHVEETNLDGTAVIGKYTGHTRGECVALARSDGWMFHRDRRLTCPECRKIKGGKIEKKL